MKTKFNELLEELNGLQITQKSYDWAEDIPNEIWQKHFDSNFSTCSGGINVDTRRWYETSISVIKIYDHFLGIRYITNMFSESQSFDDCDVILEFSEMKEVQIISYEKL